MDISNVILSSNYGLPHPLNAQTIFDKCALHLMHQGRRSYSLQQGCVYRGPKGSACAVGVLIADERYVDEMEGKTAYYLVRHQMPELLPFEALLDDLQVLHDGMEGPSCSTNDKVDPVKLANRLRLIAEGHGLSAAVLDAPMTAAPAEITSLLHPSLAKTEA